MGRNRQGTEESENDDNSGNTAVSDDDLVDQQLENVVVAVERFVDWTKTKFTRSTKKDDETKPANDIDHSSQPKA